MPYSVTIEAEDGTRTVEDIRYKRWGDIGWVVYLGDRNLGGVLKPPSPTEGWMLATGDPRTDVEGFKSRRAATTHLLRVRGVLRVYSGPPSTMLAKFLADAPCICGAAS